MNSNKKLLYISVTGLGLIIGIFWLFSFYRESRILRVDPPQRIESPVGEIPSDISIDYTRLRYESTPTTLPIYQVTSQSIRDFALQIAARMGLTQHEMATNVWVNQDNSEVLVLIEEINSLEYSYSNSDGDSSSLGTNPDQLISSAQNIVQNFGLPVQTDRSLIKFYDDSTHLNPVPSSQATNISIPFYQEIAGYPILMDDHPKEVIRVWMNNLGEINKLQLSPPIELIGEIQEASLLIPEEVIESVRTGNATIVDTSRPDSFEEISLEQIRRISVIEVRIEYRLNTQTNLAYPYYFFTGRADGLGGQFDIGLIIPAVATN